VEIHGVDVSGAMGGRRSLAGSVRAGEIDAEMVRNMKADNGERNLLAGAHADANHDAGEGLEQREGTAVGFQDGDTDDWGAASPWRWSMLGMWSTISGAMRRRLRSRAGGFGASDRSSPSRHGRQILGDHRGRSRPIFLMRPARATARVAMALTSPMACETKRMVMPWERSSWTLRMQRVAGSRCRRPRGLRRPGESRGPRGWRREGQADHHPPLE